MVLGNELVMSIFVYSTIGRESVTCVKVSAVGGRAIPTFIVTLSGGKDLQWQETMDIKLSSLPEKAVWTAERRFGSGIAYAQKAL